MAYNRNTWRERIGVNLNRFRDTISNVIFQFVNEPTSVSQEGTPIQVEWLNNMEQGIEDAHELVDRYFYSIAEIDPNLDRATATIDQIVTAMPQNTTAKIIIQSGDNASQYPQANGTLFIEKRANARTALEFYADQSSDLWIGVHHTIFRGWRNVATEEKANVFSANQSIVSNTPRHTMQDNSDPDDIKFFQKVIFQGGLYFVEDSEVLANNPRGHAPLRIEDGIVYLDNLRLRQTGGRLESSVDGTTWRRVGMATPGVNDLDTGKVTLTSTTSFVTAKRLPAVGNLTEPAILRRVRSRYNGNSTNAEVRITIDGQVLDTGRVVEGEDYVYIDNFGEITANESILVEHKSGAFNESIITQWDIQDSNV